MSMQVGRKINVEKSMWLRGGFEDEGVFRVLKGKDAEMYRGPDAAKCFSQLCINLGLWPRDEM